jgi:hypothetical protein
MIISIYNVYRAFPWYRTLLKALLHLGHPRVTVACQSDWALFTLGINTFTASNFLVVVA